MNRLGRVTTLRLLLHIPSVYPIDGRGATSSPWFDLVCLILRENKLLPAHLNVALTEIKAHKYEFQGTYVHRGGLRAFLRKNHTGTAVNNHRCAGFWRQWPARVRGEATSMVGGVIVMVS